MVSDTSQTQPSQPSKATLASNADGNLLVLLTGAFYAAFSLLSSNQFIVWPWVVLWQAALILPIVWLLWQVWYKPLGRFRLGNGFDGLAAIALLGFAISTLATAFHQPAVWYGVGVLSGLAALYGLMGWLTQERSVWLLQAQGYLALVFIVSSLGQWFWRIYRPEQQRLAAWRAYGVEGSFNLGTLGLQNWFPLGHQNYVAGYLILVLPLLVGLALTAKNWRRWLWAGGTVAGLVALYTTNSRGGTLALMSLLVPIAVGIVLLGHIARRIWLPALLSAGVLVGIVVWANPRLSSSLTALSQGNWQGGGVAYRIITNLIGWRMGQQQPWAGLGIGSTTHVFQRYRPYWAGREAELHYQLHSTPAQLWGELGLWGTLLPLVGVGLLAIAIWRQRTRFFSNERSPVMLRWSLITGLWGYGVMGLTDYQLDVIPITGVLIIYLAVLLFDLRQPTDQDAAVTQNPRRRRSLALGGVGLLLALLVWLVPLHRAWASSARGFDALAKGDVQSFVTALEQAHIGSPGEPYYPFMLGWVLGDLSYQVEDAEVAAAIRADASRWFQIANEISPYQEFGHSNLGWLQLPENPEAAVAQFAQSVDLMPAKQGVFYGLGYSLFRDGQPNLAADAIALEILRNPAPLTHRALNGGELSELRPAIAERVETLAAELMAATDSPALMTHLAQVRGTVRWWQNDLAGAEADWQTAQNTIGLAVLATTQGQTPNLADLPAGPSQLALQAWQEPANRRQLLSAAWLAAEEGLPQLAAMQPPEEQIAALVSTMNEVETFDQWLKDTVTYGRLRNERIGFGVLMRHDDGPSPADFYMRWENLAMSRFFKPLLPSPDFMLALDEQLQPYRDALLEKVT